MKTIAILLALAAVAAGPAATTQPAGQRTYDCPRTTGPIAVDGKLDEPAWDAVPWTQDFVTLKSAAKPSVRTRAKLAWDASNLYVAAEMQTPHVRATQTQRDADLFTTDGVFELFLDPDGDSRDYAEIQFNALGTVMDLLMDKPYRAGGHYDMTWNVADVRVGVHVDGTNNNPSDEDKGWTVEVAIPWKSLATMAHRPCPPAAGDAWRAQLARCEHPAKVLPDGTYAPPSIKTAGYSGWSPQGLNNLHAPDRWGVLRFVTTASPATSSQHPSSSAGG